MVEHVDDAAVFAWVRDIEDDSNTCVSGDAIIVTGNGLFFGNVGYENVGKGIILFGGRFVAGDFDRRAVPVSEEGGIR